MLEVAICIYDCDPCIGPKQLKVLVLRSSTSTHSLSRTNEKELMKGVGGYHGCQLFQSYDIIEWSWHATSKELTGVDALV